MHASMEITDQFYSNQSDSEVRNRISALGKDFQSKGVNNQNIDVMIEFLQNLRTNK
jgi:hypothetical protein